MNGPLTEAEIKTILDIADAPDTVQDQVLRHAIARLEYLERIHKTTSEARDMPLAAINIFANNEDKCDQMLRGIGLDDTINVVPRLHDLIGMYLTTCREVMAANIRADKAEARESEIGEELDKATGMVEMLDEETKRLREACTLALTIMEQKNKVNVLPMAKFVTVTFDPEDISVLRAALKPVAADPERRATDPDVVQQPSKHQMISERLERWGLSPCKRTIR